MASLVAFPVLFATLRMHIEKGKRWNAIEHLLLHAIVETPQSAPSLANEARLPRRLVIEVMIRLMRVGWVELVSDRDKSGFQATMAGKRAAGYDTLPSVTAPQSRRGSFVIDQISGTVFRARELTLYNQARLEKVRATADVVVLPSAIESPRPQLDEIISTLLDDDETCRNVEPSGSKFQERFAIVRVNGEAVNGLPARAPAELKERIKSGAAGVTTVAAENDTSLSTGQQPKSALDFDEIVFNPQDLVIGGPAHKVLLESLLRKAKFRVVIHSTFVYGERVVALLPLIKDAARRGVRLDVLWGKSQETDGSNKMEVELTKCRELLTEEYLRDRVRFHTFTTNSHAKILLADNGRGQMLAAIGSCNWLSSAFDAFDVSALLTDPIAVGQVAGKLSGMAVGGSGYWTDLARDFGAIGATLRRASRPSGQRFRAQFAMGGEHGAYVRLARDEAKYRIVVASHRFSGNAETTVLIPARAAMDAHGIEVALIYGKASGADGGEIGQSLATKANEQGIRLRQIHRPRLHAKFLAWDDDSVVISSQNWLSADPPDSNPYSELGIYISGPGIARELLDLTEQMLAQA